MERGYIQPAMWKIRLLIGVLMMVPFAVAVLEKTDGKHQLLNILLKVALKGGVGGNAETIGT